MNQEQIVSSVKDMELVQKRRQQMIKAAIQLFKEKGFHRTTTREIAKEAGFSIGTLYEYIRTKEDVLFLVCESIYEQVYKRLEATIDLENPSVGHLLDVVEAYFRHMDDMQEEVVIMYQEVKSLKNDTKEQILQKEREMVGMLERVIVACLSDTIPRVDAQLMANNIFVQGQMWGFRRWMLQKQFSLDDYIHRQIQFIKNGLGIRKD